MFVANSKKCILKILILATCNLKCKTSVQIDCLNNEILIILKNKIKLIIENRIAQVCSRVNRLTMLVDTQIN